MTKKLLIPLGALLLLGGCATVKHDCDLGEECVGTSDVFFAFCKHAIDQLREEADQ